MAFQTKSKPNNRYITETSGVLQRTHDWLPIWVTSTDGLLREVLQTGLEYADSQKGIKFAEYFGRLPGSFIGRNFRLKEVFTRSPHTHFARESVIPDAQCLYVDYENGQTRKFSFSKRTGKSWEVLPNEGIAVSTKQATRPYAY